MCRQSRRLARLNYDKSVTGEKHLEALSAAPADQRTNLEGGFDISLKRRLTKPMQLAHRHKSAR